MDSNKIRILLVDDDQGDHVFMRALLNRIDGDRYHLEWVPSYGEAIEAFERREHDLYFLDYYLEDRDGLELLREAKNRGVQAPLILLTGRGSRTLDVEAMRAGAADYLVKGEIEPDVLERTIRYVMQGGRSIQELQERTERLHAIVEGVPVALYRVTLEGGEAEANPALRALLGAPDTATVLQRYASSLFVAASDRSAFVRRLQDDGMVQEFRTELTRLDGTRVSVLNTARLRSGEGDASPVIEGALLPDAPGADEGEDSGTARFRTLLRTLDRPGFLVQLDGRIADANPAAIEMLGRPLPDLRDMPFVDVFQESDRLGATSTLDALSTGDLDHRRGDRGLVDATGNVVACSWTLQLVRAPNTGRPDSILALIDLQ